VAQSKPVSGRTVVLHVDDLGGSHGANRAFMDLVSLGLVTCGSVMVFAPWFREMVDLARGNASLDLGVHLTLTSEWEACRWAPISTVSPASGLIDPDGYFWRDVESLRRHVVPEAAEIELRAQIDRAIASGLLPTHLDAHMGAAMLPELLEIQIRLGREYGLVPVLPRSIKWAPNPAAYVAMLAGLDQDGAPVFDHCRSTLPINRDDLADGWRRMLIELPLGITHFALHCTAPSDFEAMSPTHTQWRYAEYQLLLSGYVRDLCITENIALIGTRTMQRFWLDYISRVKQH
jgi:chitin disaccharide deacetylase